MKKKANKTKAKLPKGWSEDAYLQVGALLEDIHSNFKLFGENQDIMQGRLGGLSKEIGLIKEDVTEIKIRQLSMEDRQSGMEDRQSRMEDRQSRMEKNIVDIKIDIKEIRAEIKSMKSEIMELKFSLTQKGDLQRLSDLEKRVLKIEEMLHDQ